MVLIKKKVRRRIKPGVYKDVWVIKPESPAMYALWRHCTGSQNLEIPYRKYISGKIDELLFIHEVGMIETIVLK